MATDYASILNALQPPRRQAAIKATSHLAELSSSDEEELAHKDAGEGYATTRRKGRKSVKKLKKDGNEANLPIKKRSTAVPGVESPGRVKRPRDGSTPKGSPKKRQRVPNYLEGLYGAQADSDESELTSLSSDGENKERRASTSTLPFFLHSPPSSSQLTATSFHTPKVFDRGVDSDELPRDGTIISPNFTINGEKFKTPSKTVATPSIGRFTRGRHNREDSSFSSASFPPLSLSLSSHGVSTDDDAETDNKFSTPFHKSLLSSLYFDDDDDMDDLKDELCFAKAKVSEAVYWPAKILAVGKGLKGKVNRTPGQRTMFHVLFLDKTEKMIPRTWLYTCDQQEFATCKLGDFVSDHVEFIDDIELESIHPSNNTDLFFLSQLSSTTTGRPRSPSPTDLPSPPLTSEAYCDLPLRKQFAYVKPILKAIMNEEYGPGLRRHKLFLKGGMHRERLRKEGGLRGAMDVHSVESLTVLVQQWCLGDYPVTGENHERTGMGGQEKDPGQLLTSVEDSESCVRGTVITAGDAKGDSSAPHQDIQDEQASIIESQGNSFNDEASTSQRVTPLCDDTQKEEQRNLKVIPDSFPRPRSSARPPQNGSQEYESLAYLDKLLYCVEVLLPEAILQILLWRTGTRNAENVMGTDTEEERLYDKGEELLRQTDWVMDVMRLRHQMRRRLEDKGKKASIDRSVKGKGKGSVRKTRSGRFGGVVGRYKE